MWTSKPPEIFKWRILAVAASVVFLSLALIVPNWVGAEHRGLYYGSLFFTALAASVAALLRAASAPAKDNEKTNYRFIQFALRLALVCGIGAVILALLVTASALRMMPAFSPPA